MRTVVVGNLRIEIDVTAYIKWENRAKAAGKTVDAMISEAVNNT